MLAYRYPLIAREGRPLIVLAFLTALLVQWQFGWFAIPLWLLGVLLLFLFRDPPRAVPASPLGVVSPVGGRVLSIDTVHNPYLEKPAVRIVIQMSPLDVFSVRSPMEGKIIEQWNGKADASTGGPRYAQWIQSDEADDVVQVIIPGIAFIRPRCYVHSGERIGQGQRCGFIHFGGQVEIWVPEGSRIDVEVGARLQAGSDIIATLVHENAVPAKTDAVAALDTDTVSGDH